ncbi:MAG: BamA/TamA family outer membrane protein, partial [Armatimonadaceae bacterium]
GSYAQESARQAFQFGFGRPPGRRGQLAWDLSVYDQNTIFLPTFNSNLETIRNYERRKGSSLRVGGAVVSQFNVFGTVRADRVGYDPLPDRLGVPQSEWQSSNARVGAMGLQAEWDRRNKADYPSRGFLVQGNWEQAGTVFGGERSFRKISADLRRYQPIGFPGKPGATFAARMMLGSATGNLPLSEQFFLGGFDLLRGYDLYSIRGDRMALASAELRVPVGPGLVGVAFVDHGAAWLPGTAAGGWRTGYGVGLRFASPVGPLRLDFAQGNRLQTYVSLGQAF